jgi:hypothetical protein
MPLKAGFAEADITPQPGTRKIGWIKVIVGDRVADPLYARAAVFESGSGRIGFVQLDTLSVRHADTREIRKRVQERYGFPGANILVAATHNHAGPAVASIGDVRREEAYTQSMVEKAVSCFGQALERSREAEVGFGSTSEFRVGFNRRIVQRDGTVKTHGRFPDPNALCVEGPIDPEVAVIAAREPGGRLLGALINFACHPAHHGGDTVFSAGWPGKLADELKARGCPCPMYINGAQGNISTSDPARGGVDQSMETIGKLLGENIGELLPKLDWRKDLALGARSKTLDLPFRKVSPEEIAGTIRGTQRFIDSKLYDKNMPAVLEKMKQRGVQKAEVQALTLGEYACVSLPGELFVELGLELKERAHPRRALPFGLANGMVGYVPTRDGMKRGGYETTFCGWSNLAPESGEMLIDAAVALIKNE